MGAKYSGDGFKSCRRKFCSHFQNFRPIELVVVLIYKKSSRGWYPSPRSTPTVNGACIEGGCKQRRKTKSMAKIFGKCAWNLLKSIFLQKSKKLRRWVYACASIKEPVVYPLRSRGSKSDVPLPNRSETVCTYFLCQITYSYQISALYLLPLRFMTRSYNTDFSYAIYT